MTDSRRLLVNTAAMLGLGVVQRGMGLITTAILARVLGDKGLGSYAFAQSTSQTFYGLSRLGADAGVHVGMAKLDLAGEKPRAEALLGEALTIFLLIAGLVGAGMFFFAEPIAARVFAQPSLGVFVFAAAWLFVGQTMCQYCYTVFAGLHAFTSYSAITAGTSLLMVGLVTAAGTLYGALAAVWAAVAAQTVTLVMLAINLRRECRRRGLSVAPRRPSAEAVALLSLGLPFYAGGVLLIPVDFAVLGALSRSLGIEALGDVRVSQALLAIAGLIPQALAGPMVSHFTERRDAAADHGLDVVLLSLKVVWVFALAVVMVLGAAWPMAIDLVFGSGFGGARSFGQCALITFVPTMLGMVLTSALLASRQSRPLFWVGGVQAITLAASAPILIGSFGLAGYFAAQAVSTLVGVVGWAIMLGRYAGRRVIRGWMLPLTGVTLVIFALLIADAAIEEAALVRAGVAFLAIATLAAAIPGVFTEQEWSAAGHVVRTGFGRRRGCEDTQQPAAAPKAADLPGPPPP